MASTGKHVAGTDGSDHSFRETVNDRYKKTAEFRKTLRHYIKLSVGAYLSIVLLSVYLYVSSGLLLFTPIFYLAIFTPMLGDHAAHKSKYYLLLAYSTLTSLSATYILAFGFGHAFNKLMYAEEGFDLWFLLLTLFHFSVFMVLMFCIVNARKLMPFFKFELEHFKKQK
eukprot:m.28328 g.28328  ORF g.28328 m.28328 type:complete len:169 (-) comp40124_c0_seq1:63-569(-)